MQTWSKSTEQIIIYIYIVSTKAGKWFQNGHQMVPIPQISISRSVAVTHVQDVFEDEFWGREISGVSQTCLTPNNV